MDQFSAKLLFQWRPVRRGKSRKRRVCEIRIVTFQAKSADAALVIAKRFGKAGEYVEKKIEGEVFFEFIGVLDLKDVSLGFAEGEVWSELVEMVEPMERRQSLIPDESELEALTPVAPNHRGRLSYDWSGR